MDAVRLVDLLGSGISGVLWSRTRSGRRAKTTISSSTSPAGPSPICLHEMNNHMGAITKVAVRAVYARYYLEDQKRNRQTRWRTPLPFPGAGRVARVEVIDELSQASSTTEYRYHHGYWDGAEREFRGFGMVEQLDTESFETYHERGLHGEVRLHRSSTPRIRAVLFAADADGTWFHSGPGR